MWRTLRGTRRRVVITLLAVTVGVVVVAAWGAVQLVGSTSPTRHTGSGAGEPTSALSDVAGEAARPGLSVEPVDPDGSTSAFTTEEWTSPPIGREVVRSARLTMEVDDVPAAVRQVRVTASAAGGVVAEERSGEQNASLVLRVPSERLDSFVDDLALVGRVLERYGHTEDVTEHAVDLEARVASKQASVARVRALLAEASSIRDVVSIESELAKREAELDSLTKRLAQLRDRVAMSTVTVELRSSDAPRGDEGPGFRDGLGAGWDGLLVLGRVMAAVVGFTLPFLPVLAVLVGIAWLALRGLRRRSSQAGTQVSSHSDE